MEHNFSSSIMMFTRKLCEIKKLCLMLTLFVCCSIFKLSNNSRQDSSLGVERDFDYLVPGENIKDVNIQASLGGRMLPQAWEEKDTKKVKLSEKNQLGLEIFPVRVYGIPVGSTLFPNGSIKERYDWVGAHYFKGCMYSNCICTESHDKAAVVIVEMMRYEQGKGPHPLQMKYGQLWIAYVAQPPHYLNTLFWKKMANQFHLTASYQMNSDIHVPYGSYLTKTSTTEESSFQATEADIRNKSKLVAWFVTNCGGQSNRRRYVDELQKYIQVDIYGKCGSLSCPKDLLHKNKSKGRVDPCSKMLLSDYKFYLAFENSICTDYTTEKVWNQLGIIVPIVLGGSNYSRQLPPDSFIDVRDFTSAKKLAEYLLYLSNNHDEYIKYYQWMKKYVRDNNNHNWRCKLCEYLHTHSFTPEQLQNPKVNFVSLANETYSCQKPNVFYKNILYEKPHRHASESRDVFRKS